MGQPAVHGEFGEPVRFVAMVGRTARFPATVTVHASATYRFTVDRNQLAPGQQSAFVDIEDAPGTVGPKDGAKALITASLGAAGPEIHLDTDLVSLSSSVLSQTVPVTFTGGTAPVSTASDSPWLSATLTGTGSSGGQLIISANPAGLSPGAHAGRVTLSSAGLVNSPFDVTVIFNVQGQGVTITPSPGSLSFDATPGSAAPPVQILNVTSNATASQVNATADVAWLSISPASQNTPAPFRVSVLLD
jgi:hypothetical protein